MVTMSNPKTIDRRIESIMQAVCEEASGLSDEKFLLMLKELADEIKSVKRAKEYEIANA